MSCEVIKTPTKQEQEKVAQEYHRAKNKKRYKRWREKQEEIYNPIPKPMRNGGK